MYESLVKKIEFAVFCKNTHGFGLGEWNQSEPNLKIPQKIGKSKKGDKN